MLPRGFSALVSGAKLAVCHAPEPFTGAIPKSEWRLRHVDGNGEIEPGDDSHDAVYTPDFAAPAAVLGAVVAGKSVTVDVTSAFQSGPGLYSLAITSANTNGAVYASRESQDTTQRPHLHL